VGSGRTGEEKKPTGVGKTDRGGKNRHGDRHGAPVALGSGTVECRWLGYQIPIQYPGTVYIYTVYILCTWVHSL
jgi:hypothetical protein